MKRTALFFLGFLLAALAVFFFRIAQVRFTSEPTFTPQPITFEFQPPTNSQIAQVIAVKNDVTKIPRNATTAATIKTGDEVLVGETVTTGENSETTLQLGSSLTSSVSANTVMTFLSTVPETILVKQDQGTAIYQNNGEQPFSLRILHFLIELQSGNMTVTTDEKEKIVTLLLNEGTAKVAWEDKDLNSKIYTLMVGQTVVLEDTTLTLQQK